MGRVCHAKSHSNCIGVKRSFLSVESVDERVLWMDWEVSFPVEPVETLEIGFWRGEEHLLSRAV